MKFSAYYFYYLFSNQLRILIDCARFQMKSVKGLIVDEIAICLA